MTSCWCVDPQDRITFSEIVERLDNHLKEQANYVELYNPDRSEDPYVNWKPFHEPSLHKDEDADPDSHQEQSPNNKKEIVFECGEIEKVSADESKEHVNDEMTECITV